MKNNLTAIIIDDEQNSIDVLLWELDGLDQQVDVIGTYVDPAAGLRATVEHEPDVVFLDVEMPHMSGLEVAKQLVSSPVQIIFTTAYDHYAITAIKRNASDYLLKPIQKEDLAASIKNIRDRNIQHIYRSFSALHDQLKAQHQEERRLIIPTSEGLEFLEPKKIVRCESDSNYTHIHREGEKVLLVAKTLKDIHHMLDKTIFLRVHKSHLVNYLHVKRFSKSDGGQLVLSDGSAVPLSRNKKGDFLGRFD